MNPMNPHTSHLAKRYWLFLLMMLFVVTSCTDDDWDTPSSGNGEVKISLALKSGEAQNEASDEDIFDLRLIAFETTDGTAINGVRNMLLHNKPTTSITNSTLNFALPKGRYIMYFIANANNRIASPELSEALQNITTEDQLKAVLLKYGTATDGNVPAYPFVMTSSKLDRTFTADTSMDVEMLYSCAKVSYTLTFDNAATGISSSFRGEKLEIRCIQFKHLATKSNLLDSIYYSDQTFFNAGKTLTGGAATVTEFNNNTWTYEGEAYIPECVYSSSATEYAYMEIVAGIVGSSVDMVYKIDIKGRPGDLAAKTTSRGTEYKIAGQFKNPGESDGLEASITILDWTLQSFDITIGNTTLWLSKTKGGINSLQNDSIFYDTNAETFEFELEELSSGFAPVLVEKVSADGKSWLRVSMNPDVDISGISASELKGALMLSLKVNNLTKVIDIEYDLTPMLIVNPLVAVIDFNGSVNYTTVSFSTNLGGIRIANVSSTNISVAAIDPDVNNGTIRITAQPHTTTQTYTFNVYPKISGYDYLMQTVTVIVKPAISGWRIYVRVLNDKVSGNTWQSASTPTDDGWSDHRAYIYTQNSSGTVWRFVDYGWPGDRMTYDSSNPGWYFFDLPVKEITVGSETRTPKPGETLIMFVGTDQNWPFDRHRYPFNLEPGIPLFDFADQEGWIIYDPTTDFYEFYDDKPDIFDVNYTVYYKSDSGKVPTGFRWYRNYGIAGDNKETHTIWSAAAGSYISMSGPDANGYYWGIFTLKAWEHNTSKDITVQFSTGEYGILYGGNEYIDVKGSSSTSGVASGTFMEGMWAKGKNIPTPPSLPAKASGTNRIFYYNSNAWSPVAIHYWSGTGTPAGTTWPGYAMKNWYGNWYYYDVPTSYNLVIFNNNNNGGQTGNLTISNLSAEGMAYYKNGWYSTKP